MSMDTTGPLSSSKDQLPLYKWFDMERVDPEAEITAESFQAQRNKNEYSDRTVRISQRVRAAARLVIGTTIKPRSLADIYVDRPETEAMTDQPLVTDSQNGHEKWPGQDALQSGGRPVAETEYSTANFEPHDEERMEAGTQQLTFEETIAELEEGKRSFNFSAANAALEGLKRVLGRAASVRAPEIDVSKYARVAGMPLQATKVLAKKASERTSDWIENDEDDPRRILKNAIGMGFIALSALGVAYAVQRGIPGAHNSHSVQAAVHNNVPKRSAATPELTLPIHLHAFSVQAAHHAHRVTSAAKHAAYHVEHLKYYGDTISYHAEAKLQSVLGHKPSLTQLNDYVNRTLKLNKLTPESAMHMFKGQHFKLPFIHR